MGINKDRIKKALFAFGLSITTQLLKDPKALEDYIKMYLDENIKKTDPYTFTTWFEKGISLVDQIDPTHMDLAKEFIKENNLDIREITATIRTNLPRFDKEWVMNWLKDNHKEFYNAIYVHPDRRQLESWLSRQVQDIGNHILDSIS